MRGVVMAAVLLGCAAGAAAQAPFLSAREARAAFFGLDMGGVHQPGGARWRECTRRDGKTTYWYGDRIDQGRLTVRDDGALCFSYATTQYREASCWRARREGAGYRFEETTGSSDVFIATRAQRVRSCPGPEVPVS